MATEVQTRTATCPTHGTDGGRRRTMPRPSFQFFVYAIRRLLAARRIRPAPCPTLRSGRGRSADARRSPGSPVNFRSSPVERAPFGRRERGEHPRLVRNVRLDEPGRSSLARAASAARACPGGRRGRACARPFRLRRVGRGALVIPPEESIVASISCRPG